MPLIDVYLLSQNANIQQRTQMAMITAALWIIAGGGNPSASRVAAARDAMQNPAQQMKNFIWYVVADAAVQAQGEAVPDAVIQSVIDSNYPVLWP